MKSKLYIPLLVVLVLVAGFLIYRQKTETKKDEVHYHAGFKVFMDGELQDFSDFKYMSVIPCGPDEEGEHLKEEVQHEKVHLHDNVGDIVHVHRPSVIWRDLFTNIKFPLEDKREIQGYINSQKVDDILNQPIKSYDSVVIIIDKIAVEDTSVIESYLKQAVTKDQIIEAEKLSESCGTSNTKSSS